MRNLCYNPGDVIIYFSTIYGACHKTIEYLSETTPVTSRVVEFTYPISDAELIQKFQSTIEAVRKDGKIPKLAIFDSIVSMPGVLHPFIQLTKICREEKILSLIDGAHSIGSWDGHFSCLILTYEILTHFRHATLGQIPIDLTSLDPDFYISNLHKW